MYKLQIGLTHDIHCQNFYQFAFHIKKGGLEYDEHTSIADDDDLCMMIFVFSMMAIISLKVVIKSDISSRRMLSTVKVSFVHHRIVY